jgi:hypothetical protein
MSNPTENSYISSIFELTNFINQYSQECTNFSKQAVISLVQKRFQLTKNRSVYYSDHLAIYFSEVNKPSFSNTLFGLKKLKSYNEIPIIICIVRPASIELLLANATFLKKVSHTSAKKLRVDNVCGNFQGPDILREYGFIDGLSGAVVSIENIPDNFEKLFLIHREFTWEENLLRLVEATNSIVPTGKRYTPSQQEKDNILASAEIAHSLSCNPEYVALSTTLNRLVTENQSEILEAGKISSHKSRGDKIEEIITKSESLHRSDDLIHILEESGLRVLIDIKTKVLNLSSNPKAYNIDKVLENLGTGNTVFCFFFIGLDLETQILSTRLISILDTSILHATRIQFHWAGRNSKGTTQLTGNFLSVFSPNYGETVDVEESRGFLQRLIDL